MKDKPFGYDELRDTTPDPAQQRSDFEQALEDYLSKVKNGEHDRRLAEQGRFSIKLLPSFTS